jgi:hypothetical protein
VHNQIYATKFTQYTFAALAETITLIEQIDEAIDEHGEGPIE